MMNLVVKWEEGKSINLPPVNNFHSPVPLQFRQPSVLELLFTCYLRLHPRISPLLFSLGAALQPWPIPHEPLLPSPRFITSASAVNLPQPLSQEQHSTVTHCHHE
jgi:hypothetical protein